MPRPDIAIEVVVGPEFIAGSTRLRSGTSQKLVLNLLSTLTMVKLGKTYGNLMVDLRATNEKLRVRAVRTVVAATGVSEAEATAAVQGADGSVKTAILMVLAGVDGTEARARLATANGSPQGRAHRGQGPTAAEHQRGVASRRPGDDRGRDRLVRGVGGYFADEIRSVMIVDPTKRTVSRAAPATVHCSSDDAATAPNPNISHHMEISKK